MCIKAKGKVLDEKNKGTVLRIFSVDITLFDLFEALVEVRQLLASQQPLEELITIDLSKWQSIDHVDGLGLFDQVLPLRWRSAIPQLQGQLEGILA